MSHIRRLEVLTLLARVSPSRAAVRRANTLLYVLLSGVSSACGSDVSVIQPPPSDPTGGGNGTVERAELTIVALPAGDAAAVAGALGSTHGGLAAASVTIRRFGDSSSQTANTDSLGQAKFSGLLEGSYDVSVVRLLSGTESQQVASTLGAEFADVNAVGGGAIVQVTAPGTVEEVEVIAGRRGSLVISEVFIATPRSTGSVYNFAEYIELYNNADTTVYLGGKVLAHGLWHLQDRPDPSCEMIEQWREDPDGIWTQWYVRFPGSARSHPVQPGEAVLIAQDGIDHGALWPGMPNLSRAQFESVGTNDTDNPLVPNLIELGPVRWQTVLGHGIFTDKLNAILILAEAVDPAQLPAADLPVRNPRHHRIPKEKILDVVTLLTTPEREAGLPVSRGFCHPVVPASFDRGPARIMDESVIASITRRVLAITPGGRPVLQRTGTSASDVRMWPMSPGEVP